MRHDSRLKTMNNHTRASIPWLLTISLGWLRSIGEEECGRLSASGVADRQLSKRWTS